MQRLTNWFAKLVFVFLYIPIIAVIVYSFNSSRSPRRWEGLTLKWYYELVDDVRLMDALQVSFKIGVLSAALATVIGFLTALALAKYSFKWKKVIMLLILLPIVVPEIVLGASLLTVFSDFNFRLGLWSMALGHLIITLPLATLVIYSALVSLDGSLQEAAQDLGCKPIEYFKRVLFPLMRTPILAAALLSFTTSFGNIVISTFTNGVGFTTVPIRVYSLLKTGITPEINALGAVLILLTILLLVIIGVTELGRITTRSSSSIGNNKK